MKNKNDQALEIARCIATFMEDYAPTHLTNSKHTLQSYESALTLYVAFLETKCYIKPGTFGYLCFEKDYIERWLKWLAEERQCSPATCNNRLSAFRTFIKYLSSKNIKYQYLILDAEKIPLRKTAKRKITGLTRAAVKAIMEEPDVKTEAGIRDLTFLVVLYATAARVDEILSLQISNLHLDSTPPYVTVIGKGSNIRTLYLLPKAVMHLRQYIEIFHGRNILINSGLCCAERPDFPWSAYTPAKFQCSTLSIKAVK